MQETRLLRSAYDGTSGAKGESENSDRMVFMVSSKRGRNVYEKKRKKTGAADLCGSAGGVAHSSECNGCQF